MRVVYDHVPSHQQTSAHTAALVQDDEAQPQFEISSLRDAERERLKKGGKRLTSALVAICQT